MNHINLKNIVRGTYLTVVKKTEHRTVRGDINGISGEVFLDVKDSGIDYSGGVFKFSAYNKPFVIVNEVYLDMPDRVTTLSEEKYEFVFINSAYVLAKFGKVPALSKWTKLLERANAHIDHGVFAI